MSTVHDLAPVGAQTLRALARYPGRTAFKWSGGSLSYRGALSLIGRFQAIFRRDGIEHGRRVALLSTNRADAWCAGVAAQASRAAITWLHPLGSLEDQLFQLEDVGATTLIVDSDALEDRGRDIVVRASGLVTIYTLGRADYGNDLLAAAELLGTATARAFDQPEDIATINYTGGTTGRSKGAVRRHREYAGFASAILADFELPSDPQYLAVAPISHVAGTKVLPVLMRGGTVHLMRTFEPAQVLSTIEQSRINCTLLVPTMIYGLLDHPNLEKSDVSSLDLVMYGASPMSPSRLAEGIERIGPVFSQLYGQTECYPIMVLRKADHDLRRPDLLLSCGFPVSACDVKILDENDREVDFGEIGEVCARGAHTMTEYWNRPDQTAESLRHGWLRTGDIARANEEGYYFILDRKKDMIVTGGFNVYPREIEDILATHPDVSLSAVVGAPDDKWGEAVTAFVVLREGAVLSPDAIISLVRARKGPAYAPKQVKLVASLPMTGVGKVDKKALRGQLWAGRDRMVG
ncbi:AMP-binding protein [Bradyrhizobium tropiciagri]|uniref:AMP-binding protein n=1 Tax=Bradyrhizobium tropiciagri TaxID=312253 RepID=UPI001BA71E59|nr:AMP-binding protein [Bradyrhizobium tropiciagri]MBR0896729.1 AMP-binding protein [Bradyrhizobium tropiciagri]